MVNLLNHRAPKLCEKSWHLVKFSKLYRFSRNYLNHHVIPRLHLHNKMETLIVPLIFNTALTSTSLTALENFIFSIERFQTDNSMDVYHRKFFIRTFLNTGFLCTELATRGSGSSFSVGCGDRCGVLHGDYRFHT